MKRYLVCSLLMINAVSAQAEQAEWCKGWTGCESATSVIDTVRSKFTAHASGEKAEGASQKLDGQTRWCSGYTGCETLMGWIDYLTTQSAKKEDNKEVRNGGAVNDSNFDWIKAKTEEVKVRADLTIEDLKKQSSPLSIEQNARHLAAFLAACQNGNLEKCKDYGTGVDAYQVQLAASKKSAIELSQLSIQASGLKKELSTAQEAIFEANKTRDLSKTLVAIEHYNLIAQKIDALVKGIKTGTVNQDNPTKKSGPSIEPVSMTNNNNEPAANIAPVVNVQDATQKEENKVEPKEVTGPASQANKAE
jgi:hypothetical protein